MTGHTIKIIRRKTIFAAILGIIGLALGPTAAAAPVDDGLRLFWDRAVQRAGREETIWLYIQDTTDTSPILHANLTVPAGLTLIDPASQDITAWGRQTVYFGGKGQYACAPEPHPSARVAWRVRAGAPLSGGQVSVTVTGDGGTNPVSTSAAVSFTAPLVNTTLDYVPEPQPVHASDGVLVGMMDCPLYKPGEHTGWDMLDKSYPWRRPALGWYDESDPEVTDWDIKYALEHGVDFMAYCWYRAYGTEGQPIQMNLSHAIHEGLFHSRYGDRIKFAIMYINGTYSGVSGEADLLGNLFPFWMENYFKRPNYLVVDNKPVLYIYDTNRLVKDLGTTAAVKVAVDKMRAAAVAEGFDGLWVIGESRQLNNILITKMRDSGFDASFAYCWGGVPDGADDATAEDYIMARHQERLDWNVLPFLPTLTFMWDPDPWEVYGGHTPNAHFKMSAVGFRDLCQRVKTFMQTKMPAGGIGQRIIMLDNWNEWTEGHYLAPCRENGFSYLDAFRDVFTSADPVHLDLLPEEVGRGPYEQAHQYWMENQRAGCAATQHVWHFDKWSEGWRGFNGQHVWHDRARGVLFGDYVAGASYPRFSTSQPLNLHGEDYHYIVLKFVANKFDAPQTGVIWFYTWDGITQSVGVFGASPQFTFKPGLNRIVVDMSKASGEWNTSKALLRIMPLLPIAADATPLHDRGASIDLVYVAMTNDPDYDIPTAVAARNWVNYK